MNSTHGLVAADTLDGSRTEKELNWDNSHILYRDKSEGFIWIPLDFTNPFSQQ